MLILLQGWGVVSDNGVVLKFSQIRSQSPNVDSGMIIECPSCSARFKVAGDKIKPSGSKVRCSKCKKVFRAMPDGTVSLKKASKAPPKPRLTDPFAFDDPFGSTEGPSDVALSDTAAAVRRDPPPKAQQAPSMPTPPPARDDLFGEVEDESYGGVSPSGGFAGENPFERDDPFAMTAFDAEEAAKEFDDSGFGLTNLPEDSIAPDPGAFAPPAGGGEPFGNAEDPLAPMDPFAATGFSEEGASQDGFDVGGGESQDFVIEHFGGAEPPARQMPAGGIEVEPMPGLMTNEDGLGSAQMADAVAGGGQSLSANGDISMLGNSERAAMFMDAQESQDDHWQGGAVFDPDAGAAVGPGDDIADKLQRSAPSPSSSSNRRQRPQSGSTPRQPRRRKGADARQAPRSATAPVVIPAGLVAPAQSVRRDDGGILQTIANLVLILFLVLSGFMGFVAFVHDGVLDFARLDVQIAAAFGQAEVVLYGPVVQGQEVVKPKPVEKPIEPLGMVIEHDKPNFFPNAKGNKLLVLEGRIINRTGAAVVAPMVDGKLFDTEGAELESRRVSAGRTLTEEELMDLNSAGAADKLYASVAKEVAELSLGPGEAMEFTLVFLKAPKDARQIGELKVEPVEEDKPQSPKESDGAKPAPAEDKKDAAPKKPARKRRKGRKGK